MQIEKYQGCSNSLSTVATSCGATVAQSHASLFPTRLALARWMYGGDIPHVHSCTHHIARAAWYEQAQQEFQAWIDAGGFHVPELVHADSAIQDGSAYQRRSNDIARGGVWRLAGQCSHARRGDARRSDARSE